MPQLDKRLQTTSPAKDVTACRKTVVLMSTYNGESYVEAQLRSILDQLPSNGVICVRDDGSKDTTVERIASFVDPRIQLTEGSNLGFGASFLTLLMQVPVDTEMVMFADQDDVWLPGKVERAWQHLAPHSDHPALYSSAQMLVDANLNILQSTAPWPREPSFHSALSENIVTGCTAALNMRAIALVRSGGIPKEVYFHDWWLYLIVSAFGTVISDPEPTLLYRQHGRNQIGHGNGWLGRNLQILRFLLSHDWVGILLDQITAFNARFGKSLPDYARVTMQTYFDISARSTRPRGKIFWGTQRWRQTYLQELLFRALLAAYVLHAWPLPHRRRKSRI